MMPIVIFGFVLAHVLCFLYAIRVLRTQREARSRQDNCGVRS